MVLLESIWLCFYLFSVTDLDYARAWPQAPLCHCKLEVVLLRDRRSQPLLACGCQRQHLLQASGTSATLLIICLFADSPQ